MITVRVHLPPGVIRFDVSDLETARLRLFDSLFPSNAWCELDAGHLVLAGNTRAVIRLLTRRLAAEGHAPVPFEMEVTR